MAYDPKTPPALLANGIGGATGLRHFAYRSTVDSVATVLGAGYFTNARKLGLRVGDALRFIDPNNDSHHLQVSAIDEAGAGTVEFPGVAIEAIPETGYPDVPGTFLVGYEDGVQGRFAGSEVAAKFLEFTRATQAQAVAGVLNDKSMTPLLTQQHIEGGSFTPAFSNAVPIRFRHIFEDGYYVEASGNDDWSRLTAANAICRDNRIPMRLLDDMKLGSPLEMAVGPYSIKAEGIKITADSISDDFALKLYPHSSDERTGINSLSGLILQGARSEASNGDGIFLGRPSGMASGNVAQFSFHDLKIDGFRDLIKFGDQSWLNKFYNFLLRKGWRYGLNVDAQTNAGENYAFFGGVIADCVNVAGTGTAIYMPKEGNADLFLHSTSLDYCDVLARVDSGLLGAFGSHFENNTDRAMFVVSATGGFEPGKLDLASCVLTTGLTGTEPANGRVSFVDVSGDRSIVRIRGGAWPRFGKPDSELVRVTGNNPMVTISGVDPVVNANQVPRLSAHTSLVKQDAEADWRLPSTVNFFRNGVWKNGVAGSPGTLPDNVTAAGALNGLTRTLAFDYSSGRPVMFLTIAGVPAASGDYGVYIEAGNIPAALGEEWGARISARSSGAYDGIVGTTVGVQERDGGGATVGGVNGADIAPTPARKDSPVTWRTMQGVGVATVREQVSMSYTSGVAVNATLAIDTPTIALRGGMNEDVINASPAAAQPTARHSRDTTTKRSGTSSLKITNNGTGNYYLLKEYDCSPADRLLLRSYIKAAITSGSAEFQVEFLDVLGNSLSIATIGGAVSATTDWVQRGNTITAPAGAAKFRIRANTTTLNGTAWFDDVEIWRL